MIEILLSPGREHGAEQGQPERPSDRVKQAVEPFASLPEQLEAVNWT